MDFFPHQQEVSEGLAARWLKQMQNISADQLSKLTEKEGLLTVKSGLHQRWENKDEQMRSPRPKSGREREPEPHRKQVAIWLNTVPKTKLWKQNLTEDRTLLSSASLSSLGRLISSNSERKKSLDVTFHPCQENKENKEQNNIPADKESKTGRDAHT